MHETRQRCRVAAVSAEIGPPTQLKECCRTCRQTPLPPHSHLRADDTAVMKLLRRGTRSDLLYVLIQTEGGVSAMVFP